MFSVTAAPAQLAATPSELAVTAGLVAAPSDPIERMLETVLDPGDAGVPVVYDKRVDHDPGPLPLPAPVPTPTTEPEVEGWPASDQVDDWSSPSAPLPPSEAAGAPTDLDDEMEDLLRRIRLPHMRDAAPRLLTAAEAMGWGPADVLRAFLREEAEGRCRSSVTTRRAAAHFPTGRTFDEWKAGLSSIPVPTQDELRGLEWIERRENLVLWGPPGTGKSFFAEALGHSAVDGGHRVRWVSIDELGLLVRRHRRDGTMVSRLQRVLRAELVVVDGIGVLPPERDAAEGLYRLVDAAYELRSVLLTSNLDPGQLATLLPGVGAAISDRLLHHAQVCRTSGGSLRHIRIDG